jgi:hypothetical protein
VPKSRGRKGAKPYRSRAPEYVTDPLVLFERIGAGSLGKREEAIACDMLLHSMQEIPASAALTMQTMVPDNWPPTSHADIRAIAKVLNATAEESSATQG